MRAMYLAAVVVMSQGCVVYAHDGKGRCGDDDLFDGDYTWTGSETTETTGTDPTTGTTDTDTTTPSTPVGFDLGFDPASGAAGETLLVSLVITDGAHDLSGVTSVTFGAGITVADLDARADEVVLVLDVAADAMPGPVDAFVVEASGDIWLVDAGFTVDGALPADHDPATDTGCL